MNQRLFVIKTWFEKLFKQSPGKIFLVRHGQDTDNVAGILNGHRDTSLTELGREQAKKVAKKLEGCEIKVIYCSPLPRTHQTAWIIAGHLHIAGVNYHQGLIERDFGILTGKPISDVPKYATKILKTEKVDYFLDAEGSEDFPATLARAKIVLKEIQTRHPHENVLMVTHGDIGKMIRAAYYGWSWEQGLRTPYFDNTGILELSQDIPE
ncbi:MAG: histidine phosphatase family protein [Candidatus Parcubacteria bacterium]|nr:histidine phosphatase family protein [Candidatus Parcubacteria bacterium]